LTRAGFTLIEAVLAMVILSMAAAGVLLPAVSGASVRADGLHRTLGAMLANDLVEQIVNTPFGDIVTEYNYTEDPGQLKDASGATFTDSMYANFSRDVSCREVNHVPGQTEESPAPYFFILATVRVSYLGQELASIDRLISR
jgi:prepilin-type N-terminal cleavage/methylation domain-containing protein